MLCFKYLSVDSVYFRSKPIMA